MVFVSHDLSQVGRVADRVVLLVEGKSVGEWEREDFFSEAGERAWRLIAGRQH
jgi:ABC-type glutathione transport system ATPase component